MLLDVLQFQSLDEVNNNLIYLEQLPEGSVQYSEDKVNTPYYVSVEMEANLTDYLTWLNKNRLREVSFLAKIAPEQHTSEHREALIRAAREVQLEQQQEESDGTDQE